MKPIDRSHPCLLGFLVTFCLSFLSKCSLACPKPCACYVPTEVHCTFRYLTAIPKQVNTYVQRINLGYNSISKLEETDFSGLQKLELLMLHSNEIQAIHERAFNDLSSLQVLKMSYNKVKFFHKNTFHGLKKLVRLHMDHNKLEFINPESFYGLTSLKLVHLEGNLLRQLHTDTFLTLRYIDIFKTSSIKQIYLSDNQLSSLPKDMFSYMTELEEIYLHGNPWSCDCRLQWLKDWAQQTREKMKCKKYRSGQQCPICASPRKNYAKTLTEISSEDLACIKPTIDEIFKVKNATTTEEGGSIAVSSKDFVAPMGSLILNMTDQYGNEANLACSVQKPTNMSQLTMDTKSDYSAMRTTFSSFLVCNIDYDHIQKLWGILAMYSDTPMKLKRELLLTQTPFISYKYKQSATNDEVFTDIEAEIRTEPSWLMQDEVVLQLDRTATTLSTLHIRYMVDVYISLPNGPEQLFKTGWVMIIKNNQTKTEYSAVIGGTVEIDCKVVGEPTPAIEWLLPDGSKIRAPYASEEGRITITKSGKFILKSADSFDTGVYHCIATNYIDADVLAFRITVINGYVEEQFVNGVELSVSNGDHINLPCGSSGIPDASVNWILPDHSVLYEPSRNKIILANGTLQIRGISERDSGHFRCLAANQYGLDILTHRVLVKERQIGVIIKKTENDDGSGNEDNEELSKQSAMGVTEQKQFPVHIQSGHIFSRKGAKQHRNIGIQRRNKISRRLRGQRRQFTQGNRKIDPLRWAEILEKTKQNARKPKIETKIFESSLKEEYTIGRASGDLEESSGEELLPVKEKFFILTTRHSSLTILNVAPTTKTITDSITLKTQTQPTKTISALSPNRIKTETLENQVVNTDSTVSAPFQPTTHSLLNNTFIELISKPQATSNDLYATLKDVTTTSVLENTENLHHGRPHVNNNELTTAFNSLTVTPQTVITSPSSTSSYIYTTVPNFITTPAIPSYAHTKSQQGTTDYTIPEYSHIYTQGIITNPGTTSNYLNLRSPNVLKKTPLELNISSSLVPSIIHNPTTPPNELSLTLKDRLTYQPTIPSYLQVTSKNVISKPQTTPYEKFPFRLKGMLPYKPTTSNYLQGTSQNVISKPQSTPYAKLPFTTEVIIPYQPTTPRYVYETSQYVLSKLQTTPSNTLVFSTKVLGTKSYLQETSTPVIKKQQTLLDKYKDTLNTNQTKSRPLNPITKLFVSTAPVKPEDKVKSTLPSKISGEQQDLVTKDFTKESYIISTLVNNTDIYDFGHSSTTVQIETNIPETTSKPFMENVLYSKTLIQTKNSTKKVPHFIEKNETEEANVDSSTKSAAKHFLSETEIGPIYFHTTQKIISPQFPVGSKIITHQQIQIVKDVTPYMPTVKRYGRRRISGKRRIVRPDRILDIKSRFSLSKSNLKDYTQEITTTTTYSTSLEPSKQKQILHSTYSSRNASVLKTTEQTLTTATSNPLVNKTSTQKDSTKKVNITITNNHGIFAQFDNSITLETGKENMPTVPTQQVHTTKKTYLTTHAQATKLPVGKGEVLLSTTAKSTTKPRATSKVLRRKIPWHKLFGNNPNIQKEILKKLRKNTELTANTTVKPSLTLTSPMLKTSTEANRSSMSNLKYSTSRPVTSVTIMQTETTLVPDIILTDSFHLASYNTATTSGYQIITPTSKSKHFTSPASPLTVDKAAKRKFLKKRPRKKTILNKQINLDMWKLPRSNISNYTQSKLRSSELKDNAGSSRAIYPKEITKTQGITQIPQFLMKTNNYPHTSFYTSKPNGILIPTIKNYIWTKTSNPLKLFLDEKSKMKDINQMGKKYFTSYEQAVTTFSQDTFMTTQQETKNNVPYDLDIIPSTLVPTLQTYEITTKDAVQSPLPVKKTTQRPSIFTEKKKIQSLENNSNWELTETTVSITTTKKIKYSENDKPSLAKQQHGKEIGLEKPVAMTTTTANLLRTDSTTQNSRSKPRIIGGKAASFTALANSDAFIPCETSGNPTPTIIWTKVSSGTFVSKTRRVNKMEVFINGTLSISSVGIHDGGQYLCVASNQLGSDRLLVTLSVITYPPRILQGRSREITVHSGNTINVNCQAEGRPFPTITWTLKNETIRFGTPTSNSKIYVQPDGTLIIKDATIYDRGIYRCLATNLAGDDTFTVRIQVIAAPPVIVEEKRQTVLATTGENLKIPCTAKGNPKPTIHWVAFGIKVKPLQYVNAKLFLFSNGTLYIRNVASTDNGNYECIATSSTGSERRVVNLIVEQSDTFPKITEASPKATEMNFGDKLMLNCTATGEPKPRIIWRLPSKAVVDQWHRMGTRIHVSPNGSLFVDSVNDKDAGDYLCVARNKMGDDVILMKVSVTMKPAKIHKQQLTKQVPYGKDFKVDCKASGSPLPEISWSLPDGTMINNILLADDSGRRKRRYVLFDNGTLYLNKVGIAEEGDYTCYAENKLGRDEMKVHISVVTAAPHIKLNMKTSYEAKAGESVVLDCEANGEPTPKIFWLLPSSDMIAVSHDRYLLHENGSLTVNQVKLLDAGEYMCVARNPAGDDTKLLKLEVHAKPPIINGLYSNKTIIKDTAIKHSRKLIDCTAEGAAPLQIMWIMPDNIYITVPYHGSRIVVHKNGTLEIRNIRPSDTAEFTCVARNDGGESMLVVQLEVLEMLRRPMFKNPFNEKVIAKPGKMTILNCFAEGNPSPEIMWLLPNGTRFLSGPSISKYHVGNNGTFIIYNPTKDDAGRYRCAARNKVGYIEKLIILEVGQKPNILTHPRGPIKSIIGEVFSLHCLSDGIPRPSITWILPSGYVIERPQVQGKYKLLENGTLVIQETAIHDHGNYQCKAKNYAGEAAITVSVVVVAYPPRITNKPPQTLHARVGSTVRLNCMAIGIPKPDIFWELPDLSILSTASQGSLSGTELLHPQGTLVIQKPQTSDSGIYKCIAKNSLGSDISKTYLNVISQRN
ncbi:immunoglobulin superfamily member 10 [Xenopus laevis]|uniref:Immunoglobulin superfamily member 10 n=1 Tax=Xenopus laevis TaxID=8355 RepID=A0A974CS51_XENLA|nr:immunoglobulin superfamily member 10 [Xenopus laevis]OCT78704.1 hypothetical protein XELAEV_18029791mg [Xenopus laevis]